MITADQVREVLSYDPDRGLFCWSKTRGGRQGEAGFIDAEGYRRICLFGKTFRAARLAWLIMTGEWPRYTVDHKNRNQADDRWVNLREATAREQSANRRCRKDNSIGVKGVRKNGGNKFYPYFGGEGFDSAEKAHAAYRIRAEAEYGEFASS